MNTRARSCVTIWRKASVLAFAAFTLCYASLHAETSTLLNLSDLVRHAGTAFRGTVLNVAPGTVQVGGGELTTLTYRIRVDESFKGEFKSAKGVRFIDVRMVDGVMRIRPDGSRTAVRLFTAVPHLQVGQNYLLLVTRPSAIGMSAPVGLGQGTFHITGDAGHETAINAFGNYGLFGAATERTANSARAVGPSAASAATATLSYEELADSIRSLADEGGAQ